MIPIDTKTIRISLLIGLTLCLINILSLLTKPVLSATGGKDPCGATIAKNFGFLLEEHQVTTKDGYILTLHRINSPYVPRSTIRKPYILLHDILSTSASFIVNANYNFKPTFIDLNEDIQRVVEKERSSSIYNNQDAQSKDDRRKCSDEGSSSREYFEKLYGLFELDSLQKTKVSNSLAYTLANFGYDVWLPNLRGNHYSERHAGRYHIESQDYWDFDLDTLMQEDLPSIIQFIEKKTDHNRVGIITYSYSVTLVLGLLTKYPKYQEILQPIILIAPALETANRGLTQKWTTKLVATTLMSSNGAYPPLVSGIEATLCKNIVTRSVCHYMNVLFGDGINTRIWTRKTMLISQNKQCGRTSKRLLHQLTDNLSSVAVKPKFSPWTRFRSWKKFKTAAEVRAKSLMVIHAENDAISTMKEVERLLNMSIKGMLLFDHIITSPSFDHRDFMYGHNNGDLVNKNILKMVALFEWINKDA